MIANRVSNDSTAKGKLGTVETELMPALGWTTGCFLGKATNVGHSDANSPRPSESSIMPKKMSEQHGVELVDRFKVD